MILGCPGMAEGEFVCLLTVSSVGGHLAAKRPDSIPLSSNEKNADAQTQPPRQPADTGRFPDCPCGLHPPGFVRLHPDADLTICRALRPELSSDLFLPVFHVLITQPRYQY